ncbi:PTS system mannitol-specific IIA component [Actinoplanes lutulentus]|uniref:Mannitol-specific phosphotransferase enzyme IIA component n=1 Tax=Actinoplanes lutulentus TaxID=1287878 RepID=A0A327YZJ7_9ACTN|nr:PTS sugar transporter subunit IIA [Actinoplanes lutulentus]MBB2943115.1 PTS system mannitol-specific IIA component [Actinoplanes lutulentus]RAK26619.1 PTS system IIA component (Fru family) [Actinoplanes lutulentus]
MSDLLDRRAILLNQEAANKEDAVRQCGAALVEIGAAEPGYVSTMLDREKSISTYVGEGVAIPHGTLDGKALVKRDALAVLRFPGGVDWDGEQVTVCVAIAAAGDGHIELLSALAEILLDEDEALALRSATDADTVIRLLGKIEEGTA